MNIVTGYIGADGGTVKINGYDIFAQPEEAKMYRIPAGDTTALCGYDGI